MDRSPSSYASLKKKTRQMLLTNKHSTFINTKGGDEIKYVKLYCSDITTVQLTLSITQQFKPVVKVHNILLHPDHPFWEGLPASTVTPEDVHKYLEKLEKWNTCPGNNDKKFQHLLKEAVPTLHLDSNRSAYKEGEFGAIHNGIRYSSTIRSINCALLTNDNRCKCCKQYRNSLNTMLRRKQEKKAKENTVDLIHSRKRHIDMDSSELSKKFRALKTLNKELVAEKKALFTENDRLKRQISNTIRTQGELFHEADSSDFMHLIENLSSDKEFHKCTDYQKLLIEQQLKFNKLKDKRAMRWHPTVIKWCIYLRSKSPKGYKTIKDGGFLSLPSERTLFDYSHCIKGWCK
jgi:hypothetical protein